MIRGGKGVEMTLKNFTPDVHIVQIKKMDWMNRIENLSWRMNIGVLILFNYFD